jgi:hypothetical protein
MLAGFSFLHDGRTYMCMASDGPMGPGEPWWWFTVTRDANRYAPFRAASKDTRASVQARIVAYYANHLEHRAMPEREHWARRAKPGAPGLAGSAASAGAEANRARIAATKAAAAAELAKEARAAAAAERARKRAAPAARAARAARAGAAKRAKPALKPALKRVASRPKAKAR